MMIEHYYFASTFCSNRDETKHLMSIKENVHIKAGTGLHINIWNNINYLFIHDNMRILMGNINRLGIFIVLHSDRWSLGLDTL